MTIPTASRCDVLLVGSVGLRDEEEVFRQASSLIGSYLKRIPDGEILVLNDGSKVNRFTRSQRVVLESHPCFEPDEEEVRTGYRIVRGSETGRRKQSPRFRLRQNVRDADIAFATTHHADWAQASYRIFERLKRDGTIRPDVRFQVCLPTAAAVLNAHIVIGDHPRVEQAYRDALLAEVARIVAIVPHRELTIQWDISTEMAQIEGVRDAWWSNDPVKVTSGIVERLAVHCQQVPQDVELGLHLCYGSYALKHWKEPDDTGQMVLLFNLLQARLGRPIGYVHMPVPVDRNDHAYFAPLAALELQPSTQLFLGLVHERDGVDGTLQRITVAQAFVPQFGIATECGFAFRPAERLPDLMRLHRDIADAVTAHAPA